MLKNICSIICCTNNNAHYNNNDNNGNNNNSSNNNSNDNNNNNRSSNNDNNNNDNNNNSDTNNNDKYKYRFLMSLHVTQPVTGTKKIFRDTMKTRWNVLFDSQYIRQHSLLLL